MSSDGLRIGFVEPHLRRFGGIRRVVEFGNRLVARGHDVAFVLPDDEPLVCSWMPCDAPIVPLSEATDALWDVVIFNHEPQWHLVETFQHARRTVFYALHYGRLYGKEGSWEALRAPVDAMFANSGWTADLIEAEVGVRPTVVLGGVNRAVFSPWGGPKRYSVLCSGIDKWWKGTDTIEEACRRVGVPLEGYAGKDLEQPALGREYDAARLFAVGSLFEGFCQPGLEALACGVPLVTTDNGGCREYAIDGETALVVPPGDAAAMAEAFDRMLGDEALARRLSANGLEMVAEHFDWERRTDELVELLDGVVAGSVSGPPPPRPEAPPEPALSVVVLAWDNLLLTQRFVESVRQHTDVPYELIVVDNGSAWEAAHYAAAAADTAVCNETNLGFARGMNQGLEMARGEWVAFCNNDTRLPERWASTLLATAEAHAEAGIVVPAITAANNPVNVRTEPGDEVEVIPPFAAPPAAVIYLARADVVRELGGWGEEYEVASGEDVDLAFKVWVNDLDIVYDQRILVEHISKGTASRLDDWQELWAANRRRFLDKWQSDEVVPRLESCSPARHARNRATAAAVAGWMDRYFTARDRAAASARPRSRPATKAVGARYDATGTAWLDALATRPVTGEPRLWRLPDGAVVLTEAGWVRPVRSGLLAAALDGWLGPPSPVLNGELDGYVDGPPVEVFAARGLAPALIVGGQRLPVHGLPRPRAVAEGDVAMLPKGTELDLSAANVSRRQYDEARSPAPASWRRVVRGARRRARRLLAPR